MRLLSLLFAFALTQTVAAQDFVIRHGDCTPDFSDADSLPAARGLQAKRKLPNIYTNWDSDKTYRQLVILMSFSDTDFLQENPREEYNNILNSPGFNKRQGPGCMADYFRDQSNGKLNLQFDIYGPYKVSSKSQPYENPTTDTHNYGRTEMEEATNLFLAENPDIDFSIYDWNGDKKVNQIIYVAAGASGNINATGNLGHIWPNTATFSRILTPDGHTISSYSVSCELWTGNISCGFGTICHEFTHALGLPDIYPANNSAFSVVDEWDLMDGGNFTNYGWCPPNFTPLEKMLLGWLEPTDLEEPTTVSGMTPVSEGGTAYRIKHNDNEWYLLENRQRRGWDLGIPGKGLVVYHVWYDKTVWTNNTVNNSKDSRRFELVHADNMSYEDWKSILAARGRATNYYATGRRLNNLFLSTSSYPWKTDSTAFENRELTDSSVPPSTMKSQNLEGSYKLSKAITNIEMTANGLISFNFMGGDPAGISTVICSPVAGQQTPVSIPLNARQRLYFVRDDKGQYRKIIR